jgi:hypothetical protein
MNNKLLQVKLSQANSQTVRRSIFLLGRSLLGGSPFYPLNFKRSFSSRDVKPSILKDYSDDKTSIVYKIYDNVYLNDMFKYNIGEILEDLYDNNEFIIFKLYYIRKPSGRFTIDEVKLLKHLDRYHIEFILENLTMFHKNMGLVGCMNVLVWTSNYDINNLQEIASKMRKDLLSNIVDINKKIKVDYGNTIVNFNTPMGLLNELYLFIGVDRSNPQMISDYKRFYKDSSHQLGGKCSSNPIPSYSTKVTASRNRFTFYSSGKGGGLINGKMFPVIFWNVNNRYFSNTYKAFYSNKPAVVQDSRLVKSLVNNHYGINISSILDSNKCIKDKQIEIENFVFNDIHSKLLTKLKSSDSLLWESLSIIKNAVNSASIAVNSLKTSKILLKGKVYSTCFINTDTDIIISVVISNVIPHGLKHDNITKQNITGLYKKIGVYLVREYNKTVYIEYKKWCISLLQRSGDKYDDIDFNDPVIKERINTLLLENPFIVEELEYKKYITFDQLAKDLHTQSYTEVEYVKYGCDMVELISEHTNLYEIVEHYNSQEEKSYRLVTISDESRGEIFDLISYSDNTFPMIYKPEDWRINIAEDGKYNIISSGGYLNNDLDTSFIHNKYKNQGDVKLENSNIINTINYLQGVEYMINKDVLNVITERLGSGLLKNIVDIDFHPLTNKMSNIKKDGDDILFKEILRYNSITFANRQILTNAILLKNSDSIYFPIFVDWRGRIYSITSAFSYQGPDLAKSLLLFKEGVVINSNGVIKLKLYIGRLYALIKKASNKSILDWVDENYHNIIDIDSNFWMKGKDPLRCLAASIELRGYEYNKENFITHLPIYIDGTCNGIQHLSSMASDTNLAEYVNLRKSNDDDIPQDLYRKMADKANLDIKEFLKGDRGGEHDAIGLINMDRSFIKRCIMTIPYGVTKKGVKNQLISEHFIEVSKNKYKADPNFIDDCFKDTIFDLKDIVIIAKIIHNVLFDSYPILTKLVNYIKSMNNFLFKFGRNLSTFWKTPAGLILEQRYVEPEDLVIRTTILGKRKSITLHTYKKDGSIILSKQNKGIIPNIIHSLDAANISILVNKILDDGIKINILTIHDAFATNANYIDELTYRIKLGFLVLYADKDFILKFHDNIIENLITQGFLINKKGTHFELFDENGEIVKIKIPKPFEAGNFNLKDELPLSKYFMH